MGFAPTGGYAPDNTTIGVNANNQLEIISAAQYATLTGMQTLTNKTLTTPTIADFSNANHDHSAASKGGSLATLNTSTGHNHDGSNSRLLPTNIGLVPIGSVLPFLKSLTNCPTLPDNFVECNGQTLSDANSVFNGVVIPNLNGSGSTTKRFLRGSTTSGTTGGEDTHTLTIDEIPSHTHTVPVRNTSATGNGIPSGTDQSNPTGTPNTGSAGSGQAHNTLPSYYEVVFIMRIK